jgi:hypothetical protein
LSNARFRGDFRACDGDPEDNPCYAVERIKEFLPAPRLNSLRSNSSNYLMGRAMAKNDTSWFQEDNSWPKTPRHGEKGISALYKSGCAMRPVLRYVLRRFREEGIQAKACHASFSNV